MLKAHVTCNVENLKLPREIEKEDRTVKFDNKYYRLFVKDENYKTIFNYNLYLEENISKFSSNNQIKKARRQLFKRYN